MTRRGPVAAGLAYGALAFAAGAALGPLRELVLAPRVGGMAAALTEAVAMALLLWFAARAALRRLPARAGWAPRAAAAALALAVVLLAEAGLSAAFDATGLSAQRAPRTGAERAVGLLPLAWMVALPFVVRRGGAA